MPQISLTQFLVLSQIAFYLIAGTVAILTYIKAKNGLLNAVNTEYKKRVFDRLAEISKELLSEYDPESPKFWTKADSVKEVLSILHSHILPDKDRILKTGKIFPGIPVSSKESELNRMAAVVRSDPFIPKHIRDKLVDFYEARANVMTEVFFNKVTEYTNQLSKGERWDTLETNHNWLHNEIMDDLRNRGCGISELENEVHDLRDMIQNYFESFDPLKKRSIFRLKMQRAR